MKNLLKKIIPHLIVLALVFIPLIASAQIPSPRVTWPTPPINPPYQNQFPLPGQTGTTSTTTTSSGVTLINPTVTCNGTGILQLICQTQKILNAIVPLLMALGVVYFVWGVVQYVIADGEEAKTKGRDTIIFGIIGLAVIVGLWGLVNIVVNTFNLGGVSAPTLEPLTGQSSSCSIGNSPKFQDLLTYGTCVINNSIIPLIFALGVMYFVWGVVQYVIADGEEAKTKGKDTIIYGIIALTVMLTVWGLVGILGSTFGLNTSILPKVNP